MIQSRSLARHISTTYTPTTDLTVSIQEAKQYAKIGYSVDDLIFDGLIKAGQEAFESLTGKVILPQTITATIRGAGHANTVHPLWVPVNSITSITDEDGGAVDFEEQSASIDYDYQGLITFEYETGLFTATTIGNEFKIGLLKWIASNYNDREDWALDAKVYHMPNGSRSHWLKHKTYTL